MKENPKTVYIVTSGEYSDYGIDEVFLNKEKAELYVKTHKHCAWGKMKIEEYIPHDDMIYTPCECCKVEFYFPLVNVACNKRKLLQSFVYDTVAEEELVDYFVGLDCQYISQDGGNQIIGVRLYCTKKLPSNTTQIDFENKMIKIYYDKQAIIKDFFRDVDLNQCFTVHEQLEMQELIQNYIK